MADDLERDWMPEPDPIATAAKVLADVPPDTIPDAAELPDEVPDGEVDD